MRGLGSRSSGTRRMSRTFTLFVTLVLAVTTYAVGRTTDRGRPAAAGETPAPALAVGAAPPTATPTAARAAVRPATPEDPAGASASPFGRTDGSIPDGETLSPFDELHPAIVNLDPDLHEAIRAAAADAEADGIELVVTSGWRSSDYQQQLFDEAIVTYGSRREARRWVKHPDASTHVTGEAVDVGYTDAAYWTIEHGNAYGLCQVYANEIWHFERTIEPGDSCPEPLADASTR